MVDLSSFADLIPLDHGLCVMSTLRSDGSIQSTLVNAGVMPHPLTGEQCVALVAEPAARASSRISGPILAAPSSHARGGNGPRSRATTNNRS